MFRDGSGTTSPGLHPDDLTGEPPANRRPLVAVQCADRFLRDLLADWLDRRPRLTVAGLAADDEELVRLCRTHSPDLVILEADGPGRDRPGGYAADLVEQLRRHAIPRVVALHRGAHPARLRALRAAGFDELVDCADGLVPLAHTLERLLCDSSTAGVRLTVREREILECISRGLRSAQVAQALGISGRTVENHKRRLFAKLDVHSETHAVARAMSYGLLGDAGPDGAAEAWSAKRRDAPLLPQTPIVLTPREREILALAAAGRSVKQTAHALGVSVKTIESIQRHLFRKLGVHGRAGAVAAVAAWPGEASARPLP